MDQYKEIFTKNYCIQELECKCKTCGFEFYELTPLNYELVCFIDKYGKKYFLPTYGKYGYLDLLEKVVKDWTPNERITRRVVERFEEKLVEITSHPVYLFQSVRCPICSKEDVMIKKRTPKKNYPINWLKIDVKKIKH